MELRAGYKPSDVDTIPDNWEVRTLGELGESLIGLTYKPSDVRQDGTLVLRASNIQDGRLAFEDNVYVDVEFPDRLRVRTNDLLVCVRNGSRSLIGKSVLLDSRVAGETFGAFMAVFRGDLGPLVSYLFQSDIIKRQVHDHLGATINQITNKSLLSFRVPIATCKTEREAITCALRDIDALADSLARLISKKCDLKQAAMQQLLGGRTRLPGFRSAWSATSLGCIGTFVKGAGIRKNEARGGEIPCVRYGEIYTDHHTRIRQFRSWITPAVARTATRLKKGDLLFAGSGETKEEIGKCVAFVHDCEAYAGSDIIILRPDGVDATFMGYYLNTTAVNAQKARMGQGDAVVHISARALASIEVTIPERDEQVAIAAVLSDMDAEIDALEARLEKTRALKQAMMQELLTGRTRLV